jgi:hypothetical protein
MPVNLSLPSRDSNYVPVAAARIQAQFRGSPLEPRMQISSSGRVRGFGSLTAF